MKYKVITEQGSTTFDEEVNKYIEQGWGLQGGVSISYTGQGSGVIFCQALVKTNQ